MKKFEFKQNSKMWDRYTAFHANEGPFVEFETGEVMVNYHPSPAGRRHYGRYDIELVTTSDDQCPELFFDKECTEPVKRAWLTQNGQQHLAVDHEQKVAVKLSGSRYISPHATEQSLKRSPELQYLPSHLGGARAVWMGYGRPPVPLAKIVVSQPDRSIKKELGQKLQQVRDAVRAAARIQNISDWGEQKMVVSPQWQDWTVEDICAYVCSDTTYMQWVAYGGFMFPRTEARYDFLYVK